MMHSPLAPFRHLSREPDESHARRAAAAAWHRDGIALFRPEWFHGWADREQARLLAEKLFGRRDG